MVSTVTVFSVRYELRLMKNGAWISKMNQLTIKHKHKIGLFDSSGVRQLE
jgi:hypothetical protein